MIDYFPESVNFEEGNCEAALRYLEKFQKKARAQVEKSDPNLAGRLVAGAQVIIERE